MTVEEKRSYAGLDCLKCICAFLIVCIHAQFPGAFGKYFVALSRSAVPVFFMITGFFYSQTVQKNRTGQQIKKILGLVLGANLFYLLWNTAVNLPNLSAVKVYPADCFSLKSAIEFFVFDESPFAEHLWYLSAVLYVLLIIKFADKFFGRKKLYPLVPVLLFAGLCFGKYSGLLFGREFSVVYSRNFLFVGLPCFLLGDMFRKYHGKISGFCGAHRAVHWLLIAAFSVTTVLERFMIVSSGKYTAGDYYISTTLLACALFAAALQLNSESSAPNAMASIGRRHSGMIYIIHPAFVKLFYLVLFSGVLPGRLVQCFNLTAPFIVFACALAFSVVYNKLGKRIKTRKEEIA